MTYQQYETWYKSTGLGTADKIVSSLPVPGSEPYIVADYSGTFVRGYEYRGNGRYYRAVDIVAGFPVQNEGLEKSRSR